MLRLDLDCSAGSRLVPPLTHARGGRILRSPLRGPPRLHRCASIIFLFLPGVFITSRRGRGEYHSVLLLRKSFGGRSCSLGWFLPSPSLLPLLLGIHRGGGLLLYMTFPPLASSGATMIYTYLATMRSDQLSCASCPPILSTLILRGMKYIYSVTICIYYQLFPKI